MDEPQAPPRTPDTPPEPLVLGILGSGKGSNCEAILETIASAELEARAGVVISDVDGAGILSVGRRYGIPAVCVPGGKFRTRMEEPAEHRIVEVLRDHGVNLVVLAGFMRVLKEPMLSAFPRRIVNIHPSLLPKYPGREAWRRALHDGEPVAGCTVHYVDNGVDTGEIIGQAEVDVFDDDTDDDVYERIQKAEHALYPMVLDYFAKGWL